MGHETHCHSREWNRGAASWAAPSSDGIPVTIYSDKTPSEQRAGRLSNVVCRSAPTRERERQLGVNHWDGVAPDLTCMSVSVVGPQRLTFSGALTPPAQVVDMRIYLEHAARRISLPAVELAVGALSPRDVESIAELAFV